MALRGEAMWLGLLLATFVWFGCPFSPARAQVVASDDERGRTHFEAAVSYYEQERYADAAREFHEAFELSGRPEMLINIQRAHERAGEIHEAVLALELLLERYPQTSYREEAQRELERLRPLDPQNAPPALPVVEEPKQVEAPRTAPPPSPPAQPRIWPPRLHTWMLGGSALATGVVSLALGLRAHTLHGELESRCDGSGRCGPDESDTLTKGQRLGRTSTALSFAALALASATAVVWVLDVRRERARTRLGVTVQDAGVAARVRWEL